MPRTVTHPQRMAALAKGNEIRLKRGQLRRAIHAAPMRESLRMAAKTILLPPAEAESMAIGALLGSVRNFGPDRVRRALTRHYIGELRKLRDLTDRQRYVLAGDLVQLAEARRRP